MYLSFFFSKSKVSILNLLHMESCKSCNLNNLTPKLFSGASISTWYLYYYPSVFEVMELLQEPWHGLKSMSTIPPEKNSSSKVEKFHSESIGRSFGTSLSPGIIFPSSSILKWLIMM